jgi:peptidyl-prolyl cis-trans isomerase C
MEAGSRMKFPIFLVLPVWLCCSIPLAAQDAESVAKVNGNALTIRDLKEVFAGTPPEVLQYAAQNPEGFLERYFLIRKLAELAKKEGLDQRSPYKERLAWGRLQLLSRAAIEQIAKEAEPPVEEQKKFYQENLDQYRSAKVKLIYIAFAEEQNESEETNKLPTPAEARQKAEKILAEAKAGADFVELVERYSDDDESKAKQGDFPDVTAKSQLPAEVKSAILAAGTGDIVGPLEQPSGFYLFKVVSAEARPFEQVAAEIREQLHSKRTEERMEALRSQISVKVENEEFFKPGLIPQAAVSAEAVVATLNGKPVTAEELNSLFTGASPAIRQNAAGSPQDFLRQLAMMRELSEMAVRSGLDSQTPVRERLEWNSAEVLRQAALDHKMNAVVITPEEQEKAYEEKKDGWREATVKVLYMGATPDVPLQIEGAQRIDPAEVRAKMEAIRQQIKTEADFVRMVKIYSEDEETKAQEGDWSVAVRPNDQRIPEHVRKAILSTPPGEMTEVLEEKNGFYLFLVKKNEIMPYQAVKNDVYVQEQQNRFNEWLQAELKSIRIEGLNAENFRAALPRP